MPAKLQTFDSNGPEVRVRGNAHQVYEKYLNLARDATVSGDRIAAEGYYQFAEHYFRIVNDSTDPQRLQQQQQDGSRQDGGRQDGSRQDDSRQEGARQDDPRQGESGRQPNDQRTEDGRGHESGSDERSRDDSDRSDSGRSESGRNESGQNESRRRGNRRPDAVAAGNREDQEANRGNGVDHGGSLGAANAGEADDAAPPKRRAPRRARAAAAAAKEAAGEGDSPSEAKPKLTRARKPREVVEESEEDESGEVVVN